MNVENLIKVHLRPEIDRRINFAMQQNDVPVVKSVYMENVSDTPLRELRLCITSEPQFADPWEERIDLIAENSTYNLKIFGLTLSPRYLNELIERVRGQLRFQLYHGEKMLSESTETVELLARDEWGGLSSLPEILAAFVMPNHPMVERILRDAADILGRWTEDPSLSGYQSNDPKRVFMIAGAIYVALENYGITYINPPASFEANGQRIRLLDQIMESRMATCLDLALLTAGCLEQAGLNPLIIIIQAHAFVGVWLEDECFREPGIDEPLRLRKRVDLDEIAVFDPTCVTNHPSPDFNRAVNEAKRRLENPDDFLCVIDVLRARKERIRPLPERIERPEPVVEGVAGQGAADKFQTAPDVSSLHSLAPTPVTMAKIDETPATRLDRWRRRLLDLSLRNRLLNFRETKKTIPLLCPELAALEDALAAGASFHIFSRPNDFGNGHVRDPEAFRRRIGEDAMDNFLRDEFRAKRLHAELTQEELDRRLLEIYRTARLDLEEGGASALYLAIGFLTWYESPQSTQRRLAPILLLPIALHRKSVREGFTFRLGDDELYLNVTLLELLKQDFGISVSAVSGLDPLPEDKTGVDVTKILRIFRETIRDIDRWDVLNMARIGFFSFAKFLMWRDLNERTEDLLKNPVVNHLVNHPEQAFDPEATFPNPNRLDEERLPIQTFCPLPADASQLAAVFAAADSRSFVLEGPPGTGKSQTITNLISHCMAEGKTVLFVSEKMAALNVVYDRLRKIGLERFCLELHSNKSHKVEVLSQLEASLHHFETYSSQDWEREAQQLFNLRNQLNAYVKALHTQRSTGETVFHATSQLIGLRNCKRVELRWTSPDSLYADQLKNLRDLVGQLATASASLGEVPGHPWEAVRLSDWTPVLAQEVRAACDRLLESINILKLSALEASAEVSFKKDRWSLNELTLLDELAEVLLGSLAPPAVILLQPDWEEIQYQITSWIEHGRLRDALRDEIFDRFNEELLSLDLDTLQIQHQQASASRWPVSWWQCRKVRKAFKTVSKSKRTPSREDLPWVLEKAQALHKEEHVIASVNDTAGLLLGHYWMEGETEWERLEEIRDWVNRFHLLVNNAAGGDLEIAADLRKNWARLVIERQELLKPEGTIGKKLQAYQAAYMTFNDIKNTLKDLLDLDTELAWGQTNCFDALGKANTTYNGWAEHAAELRPWCAWRRVRLEAYQSNLTPLVDAYERGDFKSGDLRRVFDRSYYEWWYNELVSSEPVLSQFFSPEHFRKIEQFRNVDANYTELTRHLITARLGAKVPASRGEDLPNSEVGILKREIGKKRRQMSVRKLFQTIPNLLPRLKSCLLMSPLSVAQYIDANYPPFDIVVFDEASQIPVWDAVGAIARGKQVVIVGDPKQLPPTSFFQRTEADEDETTELEAVEDLESILDDCISARLPQLSLNWHYRSRHESLIAFSNYHYYNNRLLTFPSPQREGIGVSWRPVPSGIYDRGKSATNRAEAEEIIKEIVFRLRAEIDQIKRDQSHTGRSIGVVTFSQAQQTLIEDLLEKVRYDEPELDVFFSEEQNEPIFVKNLENVQGDERDVILFSICYGPDVHGKVSMNFGPMNRDGGERRLNVAITRARSEVQVFSTLRADQIDLARTRARGVRDLKSFLEYAERGPSAIEGTLHYDPNIDFDSPFEKAIYDVLVSKGWEVHQQVGCARYRIDLAVVDPRAPGRYLIGIECDGANYHRAKTARDRDKLREGVLRELGWKLHRIWSTDWWSNPEQEIKKLDAVLIEAQKKERQSRPQGGDRSTSKPVPKIALKKQQEQRIPQGHRNIIYSPYPEGKLLGKQEDFYQQPSNHRIRELIKDVVDYEGPISIGLAAHRVASCWGIKRISQKAENRVLSLIPPEKVHVLKSSEGVFLWPKGTNPDTYNVFRVPGNDPKSSRNSEDIPVQEVANAVIFILRQQISAPEEELVRETRGLFGFRRTGQRVEDRMEAGIAYLVKKGVARREGSMVILEEK